MKKSKSQKAAVKDYKITPQFYVVLDPSVQSNTSAEQTLQATGPFKSQEQAETWITESSGDDWLNCCGCLRDGPAEAWGSTHIITQVVRRVRPVPPSSVKMVLMDVPEKS